MMDKKALELLKLIRDATKCGKAAWHKYDDGVHEAEIAGELCQFEFKYPLLANDRGSDADAVEVHMAQAVWTYYAGTEGYALITEILTAAYPEITEHHKVMTERLDTALEKLRRHSG